MNRDLQLLAGSATLGVILFAVVGTLSAANGTLPGGSAISLSIDEPSNGTTFTIAPGATATVTVRGMASVGAQPPPMSPEDFVTLISVVDVSDSVKDPGFCGGDANGDGAADTVLDCEIASARSLNAAAVSSGVVDHVGAVIFAGDSRNLDLTPGSGNAFVNLSPPGADLNMNGTADAVEALQSIFPSNCTTLGQSCNSDGDCGANARCVDFGGGSKSCVCTERPGARLFTPFNLQVFGTSYDFAVQGACLLTRASFCSTSDVPCFGNNECPGGETCSRRNTSRKLVVLMSDGMNNQGDDVSKFLPCGDVVFYTFAIGTNASCTSDPLGFGSLQEIANLTGGTCTRVLDPDALPEVIKHVLDSRLTALSISVDAGPLASIPNGDITLQLPQNGPVSVQYDSSVSGLDPNAGSHGICVFATGRDRDGTGFVRECVSVNVSACGNGTIEAGEECDDGNQQGNDCCSTTCQAETTCEDGNLCTTPDSCVTGTCTAGPPRNCDDGNECTVDSCNPMTGCVYDTTFRNGLACDDGDFCTQRDACVNGFCHGVMADADGDGYCDLQETQAGCNPNDPAEIPPQSVTFGGLPSEHTIGANGLITFNAPGGSTHRATITTSSDPSCAMTGACGQRFCTTGRVGDPCTTNAECNQPANSCRVVVNYGNVGDLALTDVRFGRTEILADFLPATPGCARKVDLTLDPAFFRQRLRLRATGTLGGAVRRDRDIFFYVP
jgi:cysteine-rich repeat protein